MKMKKEEYTAENWENQGTRNFVENDEASRTKHIAVKVHFVKYEIDEKTIKTEYVLTQQSSKKLLLTEPSRKSKISGNVSKEGRSASIFVMIPTNRLEKKRKKTAVNGTELMEYQL